MRCFLFLPVFTAAPTQQVQGFQAALLVRGKKKKKKKKEKHLWRLKRAHAAASPCQRGVMKNVYGTTLTGNYLFLLEARSFIRRRKRAHRQRRKLVPTFQQGGKRRGGLGESISLTGSSNHYLASCERRETRVAHRCDKWWHAAINTPSAVCPPSLDPAAMEATWRQLNQEPPAPSKLRSQRCERC